MLAALVQHLQEFASVYSKIFKPSNMKKQKAAFTIIELVLSMAILAILSVAIYVIIGPRQQIERAQKLASVNELNEIGKAIGFFAADTGAYPADVNRSIPPGIEAYINPEEQWPDGPFPGSVYDYDNWSDKTCIDAEASGSIQITLREVPNRNPDGSNVWAWYYVLSGKGTPHCSTANEATKGECVNCPGFDPFSPPPVN